MVFYLFEILVQISELIGDLASYEKSDSSILKVTR